MAAEDPKALESMKAMCEKAKDWIKVMGGGEEAYASLAGDSATGYGGAVGQSYDPADPANAGVSAEELEQRKQANAQMAQTIMSGGGNVREMAMALQNFQTMMARDLKDPAKRELLQKEMERRKAEEEAKKSAGADETTAGAKPADQVADEAARKAASLSPEEMANIMGRFDATGAAAAKDDHGAAKAMFSPTKAEKASDGRHAEFGSAKSEDHDTKLPPMPAQAVEATRRLQAAQDSVDRATSKITSLTGQKTLAEQQLAAAQRQVASLEAAGQAEGGAGAQLSAARASLTAKSNEVQRLTGELNRAKADLETARANYTLAKAEASKPADPGGKSTKAGEKSPMAFSTEKVEVKEEVQPDGSIKKVGLSETGLKLSPNEVAAMERSKSPSTVPMIEGTKANIVDSSAPFITEGNEQDMPLKSGISGTTFRFMEMAELMGQPPENARLAMVGHLVPIGAHSIHEINTAATGFGRKDEDKDGKADAGGAENPIAYDPKKANEGGGPYTPEKMKPLTYEQLNACALKAGFASLEEANTPPADEPASAPAPAVA
jgi:hypothetical protein